MVKIIGRLKDVGIAKEASRGAGAVASFWIPKSSITFDDKVQKAQSLVNFGTIDGEGNQSLVTMRHAEGSMEIDLTSESFGLFLLNLFGSLSTAGPSDSAFTHTFSLQNDSQHDSLAISVNEEGIGDLMYKLAMINSLTINITPDGIVKVTVDFMSKVGVGSSVTVAYIAESKFIGRHLSFKLATLVGGLTASSNIPVRSLNLTFEKNLRLDHNTGTVQPSDILNQQMRIFGEVELDYEDRTYRNLALDGSYRAVRIQLTNTEDTVGAGATNPHFLIDLSRVHFDQWEQLIPNDEIASQTFNFTALYDIVTGTVVNDCELVNVQSSY